MALNKNEADERLRRAIMDHAEAYDIADSSEEMLSDYSVIAAWQPVVDDGATRYTTQFSRETMPMHQIIGLFELGKTLVLGGDDGDTG